MALPVVHPRRYPLALPLVWPTVGNLPLWSANSLLLPSGMTFTRSGDGTVFEGSTFAGRLIVTKTTDVPRFEVLSGDRQGLLIESARTNLLLRSSTFGNASWTKTRTTVVGDNVVSLGGSSTGDELIEDSTASSTHFTSQAITLAANTRAAYSCWVKRVSGTRNFRINVVAGANQLQGTFDLDAVTAAHATSGDASSPASGIVAYPNGWYRCWVSGIASAATANPTVQLHLLSGTSESYSGNGTSSLGLWNAQAEAGAFPAAAVNTSAATVTRPADFCTRAVTLPDAALGFTAIWEFVTPPGLPPSSQDLGFFHLDSNNYVVVRRQTDRTFLLMVVNGGSTVASITTAAVPDATRARIAVRIKTNDCNIALNGTAGTADASCAVPAMTTETLGGNYFASNREFCGLILNSNASASAWLPAVSDAQLQVLSTLA